MVTYYLAGPMSGIPQFNFPAFYAASDVLRSAGLNIISPAEMDSPEVVEAVMASPDGKHDGKTVVADKTWGDFLARDVKLVADEVDGVIVMEGWAASRGACLEVFVATLCAKPVFALQQYFVPLVEISSSEVMRLLALQKYFVPIRSENEIPG